MQKIRGLELMSMEIRMSAHLASYLANQNQKLSREISQVEKKLLGWKAEKKYSIKIQSINGPMVLSKIGFRRNVKHLYFKK